MNIFRKHIFFYVLLLGLVPYTVTDDGFLFSKQVLAETEIEEIADSFEDVFFEKGNVSLDSGAGSNGILPQKISLPQIQNMTCNSSEVRDDIAPNTSQLFILYCCLKLDC